MCGEGNGSFRAIAVVREWSEDLLIQRTSITVDQLLFAPADSVAHQTVGDVQTIGILLIDVDQQLQRIADLHILREFIARINFLQLGKCLNTIGSARSSLTHHMAQRHWDIVR